VPAAPVPPGSTRTDAATPSKDTTELEVTVAFGTRSGLMTSDIAGQVPFEYRLVGVRATGTTAVLIYRDPAASA